jgi:hypothetical protein
MNNEVEEDQVIVGGMGKGVTISSALPYSPSVGYTKKVLLRIKKYFQDHQGLYGRICNPVSVKEAFFIFKRTCVQKSYCY